MLWALHRGYILPHLLPGAIIHSLSHYQLALDHIVLQIFIISTPFATLLLFIFLAFHKGRHFIYPFVSLILGIVLAECLFRLIFVITDTSIAPYRNFSFNRFPKIYVSDPHIGYRMKPLTSGPVLTSDFAIQYDINSLGHRDEPFNIYKSSKQPVALFLGDSQTFGEGVPIGNRFSDLVRNAFPNSLIQNSGVPGYGLHQMVQYYEHYGQALNPCVVFLCLIEEDIRRAWRANVLNDTTPIQVTTAHSRPIDRLYHGYYARRFGTKLHNALTASWLYSFASVKIRIAVVSKSIADRDAKLWAQASDRVSIDNDTLANVSREWIEHIHNIALSNNTLLIVINITTDHIQYLAKLCDDLDIPYCDVAAQLNQRADIRYALDPHYNALGHAIIGDAIISFLHNYSWPTMPCIMQ